MPNVFINDTEIGNWQDVKFAFGSARRANPQRPNLAVGKGSLEILNHSAILSERIRVTEGSVTLFEGVIRDEVKDSVTNISRYQIEGLLSEVASERIEVSQNEAVAQSNSDAVQNILRNAFGLSSVDVSLRATPLRRYAYKGGASGYASRYALVAGGIPFVTSSGSLGVKDPTVLPDSGVITISSSANRIASIDPQNLNDALWNAAVVPFIDDGGVSGQTRTVRVAWTGRNNGSQVDTIDLGDPPANSRYANVELVPQSSGLRVQAYSNPSGIVREWSAPPSAQQGQVRVGVIGVPSPTSATLSGNVITVRSPALSTPPRLIQWTISNPTQNISTPSWWPNVDRPTAGDTGLWLRTVSLLFTVTYDIITDDVQQNIIVENPQSIQQYGRRELNFPTWFSQTARSAVQSRIDALSQPRNIYTVTLYVDQRDTARTAEIARIQPGDFVNLNDVSQTVFVQHVSYSLSFRGVRVKVLTCIETGQGTTPVTPVSNALAWKGGTLRWRNRDLTWR